MDGANTEEEEEKEEVAHQRPLNDFRLPPIGRGLSRPSFAPAAVIAIGPEANLPNAALKNAARSAQIVSTIQDAEAYSVHYPQKQRRPWHASTSSGVGVQDR